MLYTDIINHLAFITVICFSFLIFNLTVFMNKAASLFKLQGAVFFIPFFVSAFTFVFVKEVPLDSVLVFSELLLCLGLLLLSSLKISERKFGLIHTIIMIAAFIAAIYICNFRSLPLSFLPGSLEPVPVMLVLLLLIYVRRSSKNNDIIFMQGLALMLAAYFFMLFGAEQYVVELVLVLRIAAYCIFFRYFRKMTHEKYMNKIKEVEKLKASLEKSLNYEVKKRVFEIEKSNEKLIELSKMDALTKVYNKITILNIVEKLIISNKYKEFSIMMFDIDNFKVINDTMGHVTGDICLKTVANIATSNIREVDYIGRYGGDEFIIVLPSLTATEARYVAERFRNKITEASTPRISVSIGIATYPSDGQNVRELIAAADKGLYRSKGRGKNAVSHQSLF